ncbi:MAG: tryptophan-rich sensory protein [Oscillospiraceae bacterium]|nr:tryptophan-rich sensory protein [Oscillospiraceae bacterium]
MNFKKWKPYLFWILLAEGVGLLAGLLTADATAIYANSVQKPPLAPPGIVFPIVWTVLYALMGIGAARVSTSENRQQKNVAINLFIIQLIVNFFWSFFFFNAQAFGFAAVWLVLLWVLVLLMIIAFWKVDRRAAWLQIPYLIWLTFAAYLNFAVYLLN